MSLPSQSSRNATRSSQVHYRRSRQSNARRWGLLVLVLVALVIVWYTMIRPSGSATPGEQAELGDQTNNDANAAIANNTSGNTPPEIIDNSPARPLPGSGSQRDPQQEVDQFMGNTAGNDPDQGSSQAGSAGPADILEAASRGSGTDAQNNTGGPIEAPDPSTNNERIDNTSSGIGFQLATADRLKSENNWVGARALLSKTLINADLSEPEQQRLRDELTTINDRLLFSPTVDPNDPMCETYKVAPGDSLTKIASRRELATHWKLIARINQISDPSKVRLGQNLKLVRGPFHAIVDKSDHRIDIYHGSPDDPASWLFIRSFDVGLGSADGTPVGEFVVSANKLENPGWVNPRNAREQYDPNDPQNPIGEFWIGLTGVGKYASLTSLGIHGTIDPDSIGGNESMGCVRLADGDIDIVYELLAEHISRVMIVP